MSRRAHRDQTHASDEDLLLLSAGELVDARASRVADHVRTCAACRARQAGLDLAVGGFAKARRSTLNQRVPPPGLAKARLAGGMANPGQRRRVPHGMRLGLSLAAAIAVILLAAGGVPEGLMEGNRHDGSFGLAAIAPDPGLTPGLTNSADRRDLCSAGADLSTAPIHRPVALRIFRSHGISDPPPMEYELDYLIPPELGGAAGIQNLWPQPYGGSPWNARAKDALEDRLVHMMCTGEVPLATAQAEIAGDWVAAYKKYFGTQEPLVEP